jgi:hypothetical protein
LPRLYRTSENEQNFLKQVVLTKWPTFNKYVAFDGKLWLTSEQYNNMKLTQNLELYLTDQNYIHFVSFIFLPGPLHRDSHKPVQVSKNFFKGLSRVGSTISSYTVDKEHVFKNNHNGQCPKYQSKKNCFA